MGHLYLAESSRVFLSDGRGVAAVLRQAGRPVAGNLDKVSIWHRGAGNRIGRACLPTA